MKLAPVPRRYSLESFNGLLRDGRRAVRHSAAANCSGTRGQPPRRVTVRWTRCFKGGGCYRRVSPKLVEYRLNAVSREKEALGEALVSLELEAALVSAHARART